MNPARSLSLNEKRQSEFERLFVEEADNADNARYDFATASVRPFTVVLLSIAKMYCVESIWMHSETIALTGDCNISLIYEERCGECYWKHCRHAV